MTPTDKSAFLQAFNRLAVATRLGDADASMQRIYWDALKDMELPAIEQSAAHLAQSAQWFPKVAEWREAARAAKLTAQIKALPAGREEPWHSECAACDDTGWEFRTCYPGTGNTCGRQRCEQEGKEHDYTVRCPCRETNRTYQRHHGPAAARVVTVA